MEESPHPSKYGDSLLSVSTTYRWIFDQGWREGLKHAREETAARPLRRQLVKWGTKKFGLPTLLIAAALDGITDPDRLERMTTRMIDAAGWDDLLKTD